MNPKPRGFHREASPFRRWPRPPPPPPPSLLRSSPRRGGPAGAPRPRCSPLEASAVRPRAPLHSTKLHSTLLPHHHDRAAPRCTSAAAPLGLGWGTRWVTRWVTSGRRTVPAVVVAAVVVPLTHRTADALLARTARFSIRLASGATHEPNFFRAMTGRIGREEGSKSGRAIAKVGAPRAPRAAGPSPTPATGGRTAPSIRPKHF